MDALKNAISGNKQNAGNANPAGQKDDYGDKGKSTSSSYYHLPSSVGLGPLQIPPLISLEKVTDSAREGFEKATGKKVPDKFSN
ncbi:hypothetical protein O1611_g4146 [Lasiodiplodia mahajangana]|uniref:Uncharacterized protein n=1 Tax=Lasiodiplodia mahajangana TaxID=1108764 RepID=A0ACC2JPS3_9PEZI|nr:hypothetical protein O1611_g4146 [Lasiodiplodia mahajangana]